MYPVRNLPEFMNTNKEKLIVKKFQWSLKLLLNF